MPKALVSLNTSFLIFLFSCITFLGLTACGQPEQTTVAAPPASVSVIEVSNRDVANSVDFVGRTEAFKSVDLKARVEGEIIKRNFTEGEFVEKDQVLFEIDNAPFVAALDQAKANLESSVALELKASNDFKRGQELMPQGFISKSDMDKLRSEAQQAKANVTANKAAVEKANIDLGHTKIKAPFAGQISKANFSEGNVVNGSSGALATLIQANPFYVNFPVDEKGFINFLQQSAGKEINSLVTLKLELPNGSEYPSPGKIDFLDTEADPSTGTVNIRATFENPDNLVLPGLFVTLRASSKVTRSIPLIPQYAVQENQQGKFVLVVDANNQVVQRVIELGPQEGVFWVVESGLEPGEKVIVEGLQKIRIGTAVNPVIKAIDFTTGTLSDLNNGQNKQS